MKRSGEKSTLYSKNKKTKVDNANSANEEISTESDDCLEEIIEANTEEARPKSNVRGKRPRYADYFDFSIINNVKIGVCKICSEKNIKVEIKMQKSNTSGLINHLKSKHRAAYDFLFPQQMDTPKSQRTLEQVLGLNKNQVLEKESFQFRLVEWVTVKLLSLNFFDDENTQDFFALASPNYEYPKRTALTSATIEVHNEMSSIVHRLLRENASKLSFTIDGWTSIRGKSYYGITVHFINENWQLHSLVLDFVPSLGDHSGVDIAELFYKALKNVGIEHKIQGITVDNASVNTVFVRELQAILESKGIDFNAEDQHFHCFPHVLNLAVQDILKALNADNIQEEDDNCDYNSDDDEEMDERNEDIDPETSEEIPPIVKLREICKKLKKSEKLKNKLRQYCQLCDEAYADLPLDVSTRWNSSHDLIKVGLKMRRSISEFVKNIKELNHLFINEEAWDLLSSLQKNLQSFKKLSVTLSGDQYSTLPSVVVGINVLLDTIETFCHELDNKTERTPTDELLITAFQTGRDKILKYYSKSNWIYCAVLILDPRHKMETFDKSSWGRELKDASYEYFKLMFSTQYVDSNDEQSTSLEESEKSDLEDEYTRGINALYSSERENKKSWEEELRSYLRLPRVNHSVDILEWWRINQKDFPRLANVARDLLTIHASSVPSERLFSKAGLLLRKHRNRLSNQNIEIQLCLNSWFTCALAPSLKNEMEKKKGKKK